MWGSHPIQSQSPATVKHKARQKSELSRSHVCTGSLHRSTETRRLQWGLEQPHAERWLWKQNLDWKPICPVGNNHPVGRPVHLLFNYITHNPPFHIPSEIKYHQNCEHYDYAKKHHPESTLSVDSHDYRKNKANPSNADLKDNNEGWLHTVQISQPLRKPPEAQMVMDATSGNAHLS